MVGEEMAGASPLASNHRPDRNGPGDDLSYPMCQGIDNPEGVL